MGDRGDFWVLKCFKNKISLTAGIFRLHQQRLKIIFEWSSVPSPKPTLRCFPHWDLVDWFTLTIKVWVEECKVEVNNCCHQPLPQFVYCLSGRQNLDQIGRFVYISAPGPSRISGEFGEILSTCVISNFPSLGTRCDGYHLSPLCSLRSSLLQTCL